MFTYNGEKDIIIKKGQSPLQEWRLSQIQICVMPPLLAGEGGNKFYQQCI